MTWADQELPPPPAASCRECRVSTAVRRPMPVEVSPAEAILNKLGFGSISCMWVNCVNLRLKP